MNELISVLQPVLDVVELCTWNRVDVERSFVEVLEYQDQIKLLQAELYTLQGRNLNVG
jgi:hypothetical protein